MSPYSHNGLRVYYYGDSELESKTDLRSIYGKLQSYPEIIKTSKNSNFSDPEFPSEDKSVGDIDKLLDAANPAIAQRLAEWRKEGWNGSSTWIRIKDLCNKIYDGKREACFDCGDLGKGGGRLDIQQGQTGDCWFLCSLSAVSMVKNLITNVIPSDNTTNDAGVYHFRFWYEGCWIDIVVDDYIPCFLVGNNYYIVGSKFFENEEGKAEYWPMLVEKAFAKLNGGYSNIASNVCMYALEALTGGFGECVMFNVEIPKNCYQNIIGWLGKDSVICAGTEKSSPDGIIGNHAYSITGATTVDIEGSSGNSKKVELLRLRNPWGNTEWKGDWNDNSELWNKISKAKRRSLEFIKRDDGEFWMSFEDFKIRFVDMSNCTYFDMNRVTRQESRLQFAEYFDEWNISKNTAGGWGHPEKCPHYIVELSTDIPKKPCVMIVGVTLQNKLFSDITQGFCIRVFKAGDAKKFDAEFFRNHDEEYPFGQDKVPATIMKSYTLGYQLQPGRYLIVPTTLEENFEKKICLRILSQRIPKEFPLNK